MKFLELIKKYKVVIPVIQRDYSEGFKKHGDDKIIGHMLVENIIEALKEDAPLDLNFVYGQVEEGTFFPVDGQQRLTTLFLLYLYFFRDKKFEKEKNILKRFSFEARRTSKEFFEKLLDFSWEGENSPKSDIQDAGWFLNDYKHDPTIMSALNVLDFIHEHIEDKAEEIRNKLATGFEGEDKCTVSFQFLNVEKLGNIDNIYIKLNARGRALTTFEIFKSELLRFMERIESKDNFFTKNEKLIKLNLNPKSIASKLDGEWMMNFFTYYSKSPKKESDSQRKEKEIDYGVFFYNFFGHILKTNFFVDEEFFRRLDWKIDFGSVKDEEKLCEALSKVFVTIDYMTKPESSSAKNENEQILKSLNQLFLGKEESNENIIKTILMNNLISQSEKGEMSIEYKNLIYFFAVSQYLYKFGANENFIGFMRVIKNLVENNYKNKIDKNDKLKKAIETIKGWIDEMEDGNIAKLLNQKDENEEISYCGFDPRQIKEEIIKAKIIISGEQKRVSALLEGENHPYFLGSVGAWLAKILHDKGETEFNSYIAILHCLFDKDGVKKSFDNQLLRRAMLSICDYKCEFQISSLSALTINMRPKRAQV